MRKHSLNSSKPRVVVIEGIDGSGKSTSAQYAASALSDAYPEHKISVLDTDGVTSRLGGITLRTGNCVQRCSDFSRYNSLTHGVGTLAYTMARRSLESRVKNGNFKDDVVICVRDVARIDPSVYAPVLSSLIFGKMSLNSRFALFDRLSTQAPPDAVVHLIANPDESMSLINQRRDVAKHETIDWLKGLSEDMEGAVELHRQRYNTKVYNVEAHHNERTIDGIVSFIEPSMVL